MRPLEEIAQAPWQARVALVVLFAALAASAFTDLRSRRIPNWVTLPALAIILVAFAQLGGPRLVGECVLGLAVCAAPMLIAWRLRAMGAGDVKLMMLPGAVSGAALGWPFSLTVLLSVTIAGGVQAAVWLAAARLRGAERPRSVPYGLAIALGTLFAFAYGDRLI